MSSLMLFDSSLEVSLDAGSGGWVNLIPLFLSIQSTINSVLLVVL